MQGHIRVLGPVGAVSARGEEVGLGGRRPRSILAVLATEPGRVFRRDHLIDVVWGDATPRTARSALQVHVSALRRALEGAVAARIATVDGGYRLEVDEQGFDAAAFEADAELARRELLAGRGQRAARTLDRALDRWRGPAFDGFTEAAPVAVEAARLEELRRGTLERRCALHLHLGEPAPVLTRLAGDDPEAPYRERRGALRAVALAGTGRQAEALAELRDLRRRLLEDLGVDPTPAVRRLEVLLLDQDPGLADPGGLPVLDEILGVGPSGSGGGGDRSAQDPVAEATAGPVRRAPTPRAALVGRDPLCGELVEVMGEQRLVSVVGAAGVGKSQLAAAAVGRDPGTPVVWCDLSGRTDARSVAAAVLAAAGGRPVPGRSSARRVVEHLGGAELVLVLDEADGARDDLAGLLDDWLAQCGGLRVLVTLRRRIGLSGEYVVRVPPLDAEAAATLLADRARAAGVPLPLGPPEVTEALVAQLDGLPLAIELAAPHLRTLHPAELIRRLDRFVDHRPDQATGHDGLMASLRASVEDLDAGTASVLEIAAVFEAPFTARDLATLAARRGIGDAEVLVALDELAERHLVDVVDAVDAVDGATGEVGRAGAEAPVGHEPARCFRLLASIRRLARLRLDERGSLTPLALDHAHWVTDAARRAAPAAGSESIEHRWPDVLAALEVLAREPDAVNGHLRLADSVWFECFASGRLTQGRAILTAAADRADGAPDLRSRVLAASGFLAWWQGDYPSARRCLTAAASAAGERRPDAFLGVVEGSLAWMGGDLVTAEKHLSTVAHSLERRGGWPAVFALSMAASVAWFQGDVDTALDRYRRCTRLAAGQPGARFATALAVRHEALLLSLAGSHDAAARRGDEGIELARSLGDPFSLGQATGFGGLSALAAGDPVRARPLLDESLRHLAGGVDLLGLMLVVAGVVDLAVADGSQEVAAEMIGWVERCRHDGLPLPGDVAEALGGHTRRLRDDLGARYDSRHTDGWSLDVAGVVAAARAVTREENLVG